jgi:hypothetical protein
MWFFITPNVCVNFFLEQFIEQQMVELQDSIRTFTPLILSNMLYDTILETHHVWILSCFGLRVNTWFITWLIFLTFWLSSPILHNALDVPWITRSFNYSLPWCVCTHPINLMGIHLLCCTHDNKHTRTHDIVHNTFATFAWDASFHVGQEQLHVDHLIKFKSSYCQVGIVFTKDGFHTLIDIVICDPMSSELFFCSCTIQGFPTSNVAQAKERNYCD